MGLPPKDYSDSDSWQSVGPVNEKGQQVGVGSNGPVAQMLPRPDADNAEETRPSGFSSGGAGEIEEIPQMTALGRIASGAFFQNGTLLVIVLNGLWIGIDVEWNHPSLKKNGKLPLEPASIVVENLFCLYFTFEIVVRSLAFGKRNLKDKPFIFDAVLVLFMIIETWIMVIVDAIRGGSEESILAKFSCLRLMRLSRLARIMHSLPELLTLVRGILNAARAVTIVFLMMLVLMYIFAIVFTAQIGDHKAPEHSRDPYWVTDEDPTAVELFGSMGDSMMSLFTRGLLGDNLAETLEAIKDRGGSDGWSCEVTEDGEACAREGGQLWLMWVFVLFMTISAFCLLNMLVGVLCEVIDGTAKEEMEASQVCDLRINISGAFSAIDTSGDEVISKTEWMKMKHNEKVRTSFLRIGFTDDQMKDHMDEIEAHLFGRLDKNKMLDETGSWVAGSAAAEEDERKIPMEEFVSNILDIRPDHDASYLDLVILQTRAERDEAKFNEQLDRIESMILNRSPVANASSDAPGLARGEKQTSVERLQIEEPKTGTSSAPDPWLLGLPTDVLFAELKHRATLSNNSSVPAIDVD